jgi:putative phosphoesterase
LAGADGRAKTRIRSARTAAQQEVRPQRGLVVRVIGVISDTHGLLRTEAKAILSGCDAIIHAGDIGKSAVLVELRELAPLTVIRGNIDKWADDLPDTEVLVCEGRYFYILHDLKELNLDPQAAGFDAVISGHTHVPKIERRDGVLYLNPGSAGPRRFTLPIAVAKLRVSESELDAEIFELRV